MKYWITGLSLLAFDLVTKQFSQHFLHENSQSIIPEFFDLTLAFNEGVAFSLPIPRFLQILITLAFFIYFFIWALENFTKLSKGEKWGSVLLVSGAIGNFIERVISGQVTDFLSLHYGNLFYFPIFNIADILIFLGVCAWILGRFFKPEDEPEIS